MAVRIRSCHCWFQWIYEHYGFSASFFFTFFITTFFFVVFAVVVVQLGVHLQFKHDYQQLHNVNNSIHNDHKHYLNHNVLRRHRDDGFCHRYDGLLISRSPMCVVPSATPCSHPRPTTATSKAGTPSYLSSTEPRAPALALLKTSASGTGCNKRTAAPSLGTLTHRGAFSSRARRVPRQARGIGWLGA